MISMAGAWVLLTCHAHCAIVVGPAKCGHGAKTLVARERHDDFTWNSPEIGSRVALFRAIIPCVNAINFIILS